MNDDLTLLREYAASQSESAFATLVSRHIGLVYSVALRQVRDPHLAEEITQAVFIVLARKAGSLGDNTIVSGWLCRTARYASADALKQLRRRQLREQEAHMQVTDSEPAEMDNFAQIAPLLDDAMAKLRQKDHDALVLRFFENKSFAEVGGILGISEDAAKMRVSRAVEKLRLFFGKKGVALTAGAVIASAANSVQAAPVGLMATVTTTATAAKGAALSATLAALVTTTMKTTAGFNLKLAGIGLVALLTGGVATVAVYQSNHPKGEAAEIARKSLAAYAALTSYSDEGRIVTIVGGTDVQLVTFSAKLARPNLYHCDWTRDFGDLTRDFDKGEAWSVGEGHFRKNGQNSVPTNYPVMDMALNGVSTVTVPGSFFNLKLSCLKTMKAGTKKPDETTGGVECFVITESVNELTRTLWIGKKDFLIRRLETDLSRDVLKRDFDQRVRELEKTSVLTAGLRQQAAPASGVKSVETHSNIVVNQVFTKADFAP